MPKPLNIVAQFAQDQFYTNYKADTDFFQLEDFVFNVGNAISGIYFQLYQQKYAEIKQERRDEVVTFDDSILNEEIVEVQKDRDGISFAKLSMPYMAFPFDNQSVGIQDVFPIDPNCCEFERTNISMRWQLKYLPATNRIFFYGDNGKIGFHNKGIYNIKKIRVLFVPSITDEMIVPDGIIDLAIAKTILTMRQIQTGVVVDTTANENTNKILPTELAPIGK